MSRKRIKVRSQKEFDACIADGNIAIVIGGSVVAWENSSGYERGQERDSELRRGAGEQLRRLAKTIKQ